MEEQRAQILRRAPHQAVRERSVEGAERAPRDRSIEGDRQIDRQRPTHAHLEDVTEVAVGVGELRAQPYGLPVVGYRRREVTLKEAAKVSPQ